MANKQIFGASINNSPTLCGVAASEIADVRGLAVKYDENGKIVVADTEGECFIGIAIPTAGDPDGKVLAGGTVDFQIKDCGIALAGADIVAGAALTTGADGTLKEAESGNFVIGYAVTSAVAGDYVHLQIAKGYYPT